MRINRFFTDRGICSRRAADKAIEERRVLINGKTAVLGDQVHDGDVVCLDGRTIDPVAPKPIIIAYHKPIGVVCTTDSREPNNIISSLNYPERVFPIGRLDQMSEGLILLTNQGNLVNPILRSRNGNEKEYLVELNEEMSEEDRKKLMKGVKILDRKTLPCRIQNIDSKSQKWILREGLNRQIRRMVESVGLKVKKLKRVRVMNVELGRLPRGSWRELSPQETKDLLGLLGKTLQSE